MIKKARNQNGSITLFVLISMLFFIVVALSAYSYVANKLHGQGYEVAEIKENYEKGLTDDELAKLYEKLTGTETANIHIGDYVAYTPKSEIYSIDKNISGYAENQEVEAEEMQWQILNINENGTVDLISSKPTTEKKIYFSGANGYNNGVYILNEMISKLYSNSSKGATARSISIEDIQNKINLEEYNYKDYTADATKTKYGEKYEYTEEGTKSYPTQWENDEGIIGESQSKNIIEADATANKPIGENLEVTQTFWEALDMPETYFSKVGEESNSIYYNMFFADTEDDNDTYWLASRYADMVDTTWAGFGLRSVKYTNHQITGADLYRSDEQTIDSVGYSIRPIVTIKADKIKIDSGDGSTIEDAWQLN